MEVLLVTNMNVENVALLYQKSLDTPFKLPYFKARIHHFLAYHHYEVCNTTAYQELPREVQLYLEIVVSRPGKWKDNHNKKSTVESSDASPGRGRGRKNKKPERKPATKTTTTSLMSFWKI
eukprot:TRINITY_DN9833_c0_g1_i2.p1 TRINITY_DN9833_c0_g1~~TRINITY_DN9833_c0_g1_i2.p1  ORF type:complete len:121 (-),score=11.39 TRINITY_DN9833_c0_g1_i2:237-599(-)